MKKEFLKPGKEGLLVRDPVTKRHLKAEGEEKVMNSYWARRIMCGDVVVAGEAPAVEPKSKKTSKN